MSEEQFIKISRELLYKEIWEISASGVAKKYNVPYAELLRLCKEVELPIPPSGYWTKLSFGKPVSKTPLPESSHSEVLLPINIIPKHLKHSSSSETIGEVKAEKSQSKIIGDTIDIVQTEGIKVKNVTQWTLAFLTADERQKVLIAAEKLQVLDENVKLHKKIRAYQAKVKEWNKDDKKPEGSQRSFKNYFNRPPFLAGVISNETLPRVYRILDALYRQVESLGGSVNEDLSLTIRNEHVTFEVFEAQDKIKHEISRQEAQQLIIYKDAKRHNGWASQPNIRKYDYVFNGKLRICIRKSRHFRDSQKEKVESRLGDMLIELYEESEVVRRKREAFEDAKRKEAEEERLREERRIRYNEEVDKTIALTNMSQDYYTACKIRAYINALESKVDMNDDKTAEWIEWAKKKADWYDPTVDRKDELLGERKHGEDEEGKAIRKSYY